jgi:hypothetical protein
MPAAHRQMMPAFAQTPAHDFNIIKMMQLSDPDMSADRRLVLKIGSALKFGINYLTDRLPGYLLRLKENSQK